MRSTGYPAPSSTSSSNKETVPRIIGSESGPDYNEAAEDGDEEPGEGGVIRATNINYDEESAYMESWTTQAETATEM